MKQIHRRTAAVAGAALLALALGACTTTGMGGGTLTSAGKPSQPVLFSWKSTDGGITGTMTATLPDATYQGRFVQITQQTQSDSLAPMWDGWSAGWPDWPYWGWGAPMGGFDPVTFTTLYSGKVIANLNSVATGKPMRCRLHMFAPAQGMSGGGTGECQLAGGATVQANF